MDIRFENVAKEELFCNIRVGECFATDINTPHQLICIKIMGSCDDLDNAVELQSGEILHFDDGEEVIPIRAELKVRMGG